MRAVLTNVFLCLAMLTLPQRSQAADDDVANIEVRGNTKVERDAIIAQIESKKGLPFRREAVAQDIKKLYELGFFSDIRVSREKTADGWLLIIDVKEKPAISAISYQGLEELGEEELKDKLTTKLYTIVNESAIAADQRLIEKMYAEKGFYLASVSYTLTPKGPNDVELTFHVDEAGKVMVGDVAILGNNYFSDAELIANLATQPLTRISAYGSGSIYTDDFVKRDAEFLAYYYKDWGFAEVKVAKPVTFLDKDRGFVRVTFGVEEGVQYNIGKIDVAGDLLFPKEELFEAMKLKPGALFRYSRFTGDIEMLMDKYGDLGYAYADINPKPTFHPETKTVDLVYDITKGDKVYFGMMTIVGNTKTRDNVIRREFEVHDSELYSGTHLTLSKKNINRLGFFEEVQVIKERDKKNADQVNLKVKVKEKPTGQLQAALGYSPGGDTKRSFFGRGRYDEQNQSGKGWNTNITIEWDGGDNYKFETGFTDPRVNDSDWSLGLDLAYERRIALLAQDVEAIQKRQSFSVTVGRKLIELVSGSISYQRTLIKQETEQFLLQRLRSDGTKSTVTFGLGRKDLDNYLDPTEGSTILAQHSFSGGPLYGDFQFMESVLDTSYYYPIDFTDTFRTYIRLHGVLGHLIPYGKEQVPFSERYRLGRYDLRGYDYNTIGPNLPVRRSPNGIPVVFNDGGDKKLYFQLEYYIPLIPQAGIKALLFADTGRVFNEPEAYSLGGFSSDVGFGFRWITPIAPFRFEWAFPVQKSGGTGDMKIIFDIGY